MEKLLLITYYWPPAGDVGVYRWLYFTKTLVEQGFDVTVLCPKNAGYERLDEELNNVIHPNIHIEQAPIIEPNQYLKQGNGGNDNFEQGKSFVQNLKLKIRANYFIPDARMLWVKPATKKAAQLHQEHQYDVVITNGPPHSCHLVGLGLKQKFPALKWVADFRDPWQEIDYFNDLPLSAKARKKHQALEAQVVQTADCVTTVSPSWKDLFLSKGAQQAEVFTNGFAKESFETKVQPNNEQFTIRHIGSLDADRNASLLWKVANEEGLQIELIGNVAGKIQQEVKEFEHIKCLPPIPHKTAIYLMQTSEGLLLCNSTVGATEGRIPAKLFEYIGANRPILYIGNTNNDACRIIQEYHLGVCLTYESSKEEVKRALQEIKTLQQHSQNQDLKQFERSEIAKQFGQLIVKLKNAKS